MMNSFGMIGVVFFTVGASLVSGAGQAAVGVRGLAANAPAHCQAFTPGPANTIRNRVVGSENTGAPMNVACTFEKPIGAGITAISTVDMWFSNNVGGTITVNCTLLTGFQGQAGAFMLNKSTEVAFGSQASISFDADDTLDPADIDLGDNLVGVNCNLPTGAVINDTYIYWTEEDGVGS